MSEWDGRRPLEKGASSLLRDELDADIAALLPPLDGAPGPARRLSSARTASMVSAIVEAATRDAVPDPAAAAFSPFDVTRSMIFEAQQADDRSWLARRGLALAAVVVIASVGSAAGAAWVVLKERPEVRALQPAGEPRPVRPAGEERAKDRPAAAQHPDPVQPTAEQPIPEPPQPLEEATEPPSDDASEEAQDRPRPRRDRRPVRKSRAPLRAEPPADPAPPAPVPPPVQPDSGIVAGAEVRDMPVDDIVSMANQRRREKRWRAAEQLYEIVMRDHASTDAAAIATVASASLHLDNLDDPQGALRRFHMALRLRPNGPLAEEARWGLAETHRALGDDAAEREALRGFLSAHPRSVNAARARQRLRELGAGP